MMVEIWPISEIENKLWMKKSRVWGFQRVSQSVVSQKKYFGETAKMKLFLLVTFLHLPNVCSSQHELCRKQIASIFCMNFDKEEIRACRKTVRRRGLRRQRKVRDSTAALHEAFTSWHDHHHHHGEGSSGPGARRDPRPGARRDPRGTRSSWHDHHHRIFKPCASMYSGSCLIWSLKDRVKTLAKG